MCLQINELIMTFCSPLGGKATVDVVNVVKLVDRCLLVKWTRIAIEKKT